MTKQEIQDKIQLRKFELSKEKNSQRLKELNNDIQILQWRYQIEIFKERIKNLKK